MQRIHSVFLGLSLAASLTTGCATERVKAEKAAAKLLISDEQENQIGLQVKQELEQKQHVQYVTDPVVVNYVNQVAGPILQQAARARPGVQWKVSVINDPKTVNAFATPGGYLYVYTGLLLAADNEAQLAGVLGHESGHVVARHSARAMVDAFGLQAITELALGKNPGAAEKIAAQLAGGGAMLAHSRSEETEADEYGATFAAGANYDPHGLIIFFQKLEKMQGATPGVMKWLSDHPTNPERVSHLNQYIAQHNLHGTQEGAERLAPIKQKLGGK